MKKKTIVVVSNIERKVQQQSQETVCLRVKAHYAKIRLRVKQVVTTDIIHKTTAIFTRVVDELTYSQNPLKYISFIVCLPPATLTGRYPRDSRHSILTKLIS